LIVLDRLPEFFHPKQGHVCVKIREKQTTQLSTHAESKSEGIWKPCAESLWQETNSLRKRSKDTGKLLMPRGHGILPMIQRIPKGGLRRRSQTSFSPLPPVRFIRPPVSHALFAQFLPTIPTGHGSGIGLFENLPTDAHGRKWLLPESIREA
jgi:hypothetical protein